MTIGVCLTCEELKPGRPVVVNNFTDPENAGQDLTFFCEDCIAQYALWCEVHEIPKIFVIEPNPDEAEGRPRLYSGCHRCAWDKLRQMRGAEKLRLIMLVNDLDSGEPTEELIPPEDAGLLEPLDKGDRFIYRLLLCSEIYAQSVGETVGQLILDAREEEVLLN